jgi:hypothetical protein
MVVEMVSHWLEASKESRFEQRTDVGWASQLFEVME